MSKPSYTIYTKDFANMVCRRLERENKKKDKELERLHSIIKKVREYITSYESIETIQQFDHSKNNKDLDYSTIDEMTRRYLIVHDKVLEILDKTN